MHHFFPGPFFNFEAIRILGTTRYGGADVAECLDAIGQIRHNDPKTWHEAWSKQARQAENLAQEAQRNGHRSAARSAFLRASNYTRASQYMMTGDRLGASDPNVVPILQKSVELFHKALSLFDAPVEILHIPYRDGLSLPAYLYLPPATCRIPGRKTPVVISLIGADSTQEEIYHMLPAAGPELGYAVLTFEGPGQGLTLHQHGIPMRPDFEVVNTTVLDFLVNYSKTNPSLDLDTDNISIAGASLGGYFALRGAATDTRVKACIAIDPMHDLWEMATKHVAPTFFNLWDSGWIPDWFVNTAVLQNTRLSFQSRWEIYTSARFLGATTPVEILQFMKEFSLDKNGTGRDYLQDVKCPTLVTGAADSLYFDPIDNNSSGVLARLAAPKKELWVGETPGDGSLQAKMGAMGLCNQRVFEFLDRQFNIRRNKIVDY